MTHHFDDKGNYHGNLDDDKIQLMKDNDIDSDEAKDVQDLMDELGVDEDDAIMIWEEG